MKGNVPSAARPQITLTNQISLHPGSKDVIAYNFGSCHTNGDISIYFPAQKVLASGTASILPTGKARIRTTG